MGKALLLETFCFMKLYIHDYVHWLLTLHVFCTVDLHFKKLAVTKIYKCVMHLPVFIHVFQTFSLCLNSFYP